MLCCVDRLPPVVRRIALFGFGHYSSHCNPSHWLLTATTSIHSFTRGKSGPAGMAPTPLEAGCERRPILEISNTQVHDKSSFDQGCKQSKVEHRLGYIEYLLEAITVVRAHFMLCPLTTSLIFGCLSITIIYCTSHFYSEIMIVGLLL